MRRFRRLALERVRISRLGWSVPAAVTICLAAGVSARAQEVRPDSSTHVVKRGDTLWDLAAALLGDAYLWPEIYRLNTDQIEDPHWIHPGDVLRLPGRTRALAQGPAAPAAAPSAPKAPGVPTAGPAPAPEEYVPRRTTGPTVFTPRKLHASRSGTAAVVAVPPRVPVGDVLRAPYFEAERGPRSTGKVLDGVDIPGINRSHRDATFQLYDRVLMTLPAGSLGAERERYMAYELGPLVEGVGQVVVPTALLQVVRAARGDEPSTAEVLELYGQLNTDTRVVTIDTTGAGVTAAPTAVSADAGRTGKVRAIHRSSVLPSLNYYVLFDLSTSDGMKIGDEIQIFRPRRENSGDDGLTRPEVSIGTGQVVRVTLYGATARVTSQEQPAIRVGEAVRITARMP